MLVTVLLWSMASGLIIKKEAKSRPRLRDGDGRARRGGGLERRLMDQIKKEQEKNKVLKDMLQKQESLSKELDQKIQAGDGRTDLNKNATDAVVAGQAFDGGKASVGNSRKLAQNRSKTDLAEKSADIKTHKKTEKTVKRDSQRNLKQAKDQKGLAKTSVEKSNISVKNLNEKISSAVSKKITRSLDSDKGEVKTAARKLNQNKLTKKSKASSDTSLNASYRHVRKAAVRRLTSAEKSPKASNLQKKDTTRSLNADKHQIDNRRTTRKRFAKKLALNRHNVERSRPVAKKIPLNHINDKRSNASHYAAKDSKSTKRRILGQDDKSHADQAKFQNANVPKSEKKKKKMTKDSAATKNTKQSLEHTSAAKPASSYHVDESKLTTQKKNIKWTKNSRKLVAKTNKRKHGRILDEDEQDYPVKLMNASISYPILGMVNLGSGEYDLNIS